MSVLKCFSRSAGLSWLFMCFWSEYLCFLALCYICEFFVLCFVCVCVVGFSSNSSFYDSISTNFTKRVLLLIYVNLHRCICFFKKCSFHLNG